MATKLLETIKGVKCPECGTSLAVQSGYDSTKRCECEKGHKVTVDMKGKPFIIRVTIPFEPLTTCQNCGAFPLKVISDTQNWKEAEDGEELVRLVHYECSLGHQSQIRKIIQKRFSRRD